jgi:phenylacetate-CoA ligase
MIGKALEYLHAEMIHKLMLKAGKNITLMRKILLTANPDDLERVGNKLVLANFERAATRIPAYATLLKKKHIKIEDITTIQDFIKFVPIITKKNYVKKAKHLRDLCIDRDIGKCSLIGRSSGFALGLDLLFGVNTKKTLLIDVFALGSWVSGVDILMVGDLKCAVVAPGADITEALSIFQDLQDEFDQFIFVGTPHFMKPLVETAIRKKINLKKKTVHLLLGAEPFTEEWRQYMHTQLGTSSHDDRKGYIFSAFGASDIGIAGINETVGSAKIRKICLKDHALRKEIFGKYEEILPHIFQYDPTKYFAETNKKDELIFSHADMGTMLPLMRYNIHDIGGIIKHKEMQALLKKHRCNVKIDVPFPFIFVTGRIDGTVNYDGILIYPEYIQEMIYGNPRIAKILTGTFKISKVYDKKHNPYLKVDFQLKKRIKTSKSLQNELHNLTEKFFYNQNPLFSTTFDFIRKSSGKSPIIVELYNHKEYPHKNGVKVHYV